ncbi:SusC/RagA family TonB-linked outer membrane protein [Cesiribacter sp. SM1]|uniref:SusC/RagA family TonB-linked outer membrane protein n=1 Tax=Cesiribacter sp. SM1 TaxID=2861196 RepID=UPI001CD5AD10|nr:SusC/RagA family TonB-linked outer membrane protein [Cesiribacter sp. SM1]
MKNDYRIFMLLLLLVCSGQYALAQERIVRGRVTDATDNNAVVGATVRVPGTGKGTVTDVDGQFSISLAPDENRLEVSFVGYLQEVLEVGNRSYLEVTLAQDLETLSEVVVTAFGIKQERKSLGYSVQEVNSRAIQETNQPNPLNALKGRVSGINITSSSGAPGAGADIVIRGINSLNPNANNQPLFVIDGIPVSNETNLTGGRGGGNFTNTNRFADINPEDIETISILKGPAASALYGLRAANGAVIITTKSGKAGKTVFSFKTAYSFDDVYRTPPMQDRYSRGFRGRFDPADYRADGPPLPDGTETYNQWDQLFEVGHQFQNNFSFSGGNDKATFYGSLGRLDQSGVMPNTSFERTNVKIVGSLKPSDKLTIDGSANFINSDGTTPRMGVGAAGVISYATRYAPEINMEDYINPDGTPVRYSTQLENPFYFAENAYQDETLNRIIGNLGLNYAFTDWLNVDYRIGMDNYANERFLIARPPLLISGASRGSISEDFLTYREINSNLLLNGQGELSEGLTLSVSLGNQITSINTTNVSGSGTNFILPTFNSVNNLGQYTVRSFPSERNIIGVFADAKLSFRETLFLNVTGRNDWSSTLPEANRSFFYPSVSLGYVFTETLGLGNNSILSFGKLRAAYAEVGKDASPYMIGNYYSTQTPFRGVAGVQRDLVIGSEDLKPERTKAYEFGVDLAFVDNRIRLDATYAIQNSVDQIVPIPTSRATGFTSYVANAGEIQNRVIELLLDGAVVRTENFGWNTMLNFTRLRSEVLSMPEGVDVITFQPETPWVKQRIQTGGRPGDWYGWELSRVEDPGSEFNGRLVIVDGYPNVNDQWKGTALSEDRYIGNAFPDWEAGWNNSLRYKGFNLSFLFTTRQGGYAFDINRRLRYGAAGGEAPTGSETDLRNRLVVFDGVTNIGTVDEPQWVENELAVPIGVSELYSQAFRYRLAREFNGFQDASFIRLQNVSFSYTMPASLLERLPFTGITASVTGNNLWMTSPFIGFDPEQSAYGPGSNVYGYVGTNIPAIRSIYLSLNLTF